MIKNVYAVLLFVFGIHGVSWATGDYSEVQEYEINSTVLGEKRELVIFLPAGYHKNEDRYPVLYLTDGDIQGPHTAGTLDYLAKFDQAPQMIVVGIINPRHNRERDLTLVSQENQNPAGLENADRFLEFVEKEVIHFVKQQYRTLNYQALSGTSHGGQFAINALVKKPDLFDGIIAISPSLYWNKQQMLSLWESALKSAQPQGRLFVSIAKEEPVMTEPFQKFVELAQRHPSKHLELASQTFLDESHNTTVLQGQYYGLKHLFFDWAIPDSPQTLENLQAIYDKRSTLLNISLMIPEDRAAGYGQWLQYLNRQDEALTLLQWNRENYPQSLNAHTVLIKAYLFFAMPEKAKAAVASALESIEELSSEQKAQLEALL